MPTTKFSYEKTGLLLIKKVGDLNISLFKPNVMKRYVRFKILPVSYESKI